MLFFVALFVEYFWVIKFLFLSEGAIIIRRWGCGDDAAGSFWDIPRFGGIRLGSVKVPSSGFLGLLPSGLLNLKRGISFIFRGFCRLHYLMGLKLVLFFYLFACRMARGHEEASTSQAGRKRGTPRETPIVSRLVIAMFVEELRSFSQVLVDIRLKVANDTATPTIRVGG